MNQIITEYGKDILIDGKTVVYQFTPKAKFHQSIVKIIQVESNNNPEATLEPYKIEYYRERIIEAEARKQQTIFAAAATLRKS